MSIITALWKCQPGKYFCISTKSGSGRWRDTFFARGKWNEMEEFIRDNRDKDIYWGVTGLLQEARRKEYVQLPKMLWADLDEADPRKINPKPSIAFESSPGRFVGLWMVDAVVTEDINRRLTRFVGADPAGYDVTQVLRMPGTTNYKYQSTPKVRVMWDDGPVYTLKQIVAMLPNEKEATPALDAVAIMKKYERVLSMDTRHELLNGKPTVGKRSEVLWRLENDLLEAGMSREEALTVVKASPWNKFAGRRGEDEQLERELDKIYGKKLTNGPAKNGYVFLAQSLAQIERQELDWVWYPYLSRGNVTILEGDPGIGKSYLAQMVSKAIVDGERLPSIDKSYPTIQGKVAYFDAENSAATVTKKRMECNGAKNLHDFYQEEEPFTIDDPNKLGHVYEAIETLKPTLVVFDTINLYIGKADVHKASETTQALVVFRDIAVRFNCAVIIVRHLTKSHGVNALYRGQGSIAFTGVARTVLTVGKNPEDEDEKVLAVTKINNAERPRALTFTIEGLPNTLKERNRSKMTWGDFTDLSSDEIIVKQEGGGEKSKAATEFLKNELADGPMDSLKLEVMAEKRSISRATLYRASKKMNLIRKSTGFGSEKTSTWSLPEGQ